MLETALRVAAAGTFAGHWFRLQKVHDLTRVDLHTGQKSRGSGLNGFTARLPHGRECVMA